MRKSLLFTILYFLFNQLIFAGNDQLETNVLLKIDSLEKILNNSLKQNLSPSEQITMLNDLSALYAEKSWDKVIEYASLSLKLAEESKDEKQVSQALMTLSNAYRKLDKYEKGIEYATRLYDMYNASRNENETAKALLEIGSCYYEWGRYVEAKEQFDRALEIFKKNQNFEGIAKTLKSKAKILSDWGEYDEALNSIQEALKFWEEIGNEIEIANSYNNIGIIYQELGNFDRAFEFFHKSISIFKKYNRTVDIVNLTLHIGDVYLQKAQYDKALEYYFNADLVGRQIDNKKLKSITLSNIGEAYNLKGDYLKALDYQMKALKLKEEIGDKKRLTITYTELGIIYKNVEDYNKALEYLNKGVELATEINLKYQLIKCYLNLSEVYSGLGKHKKALDYYKMYVEAKESLYSEESKQTIAELQARYQVEKKDKDNERLRHSEQLNKAQIKNQQIIIGFVLFILLGSFAFIVVFHSRYQQNQRLNIQLFLKNKEIEEQQAHVQKLNQELKEANQSKDKFFSIVAHDLKSPFNSLLVLTNLLIEDYDTFTEDERKKFILQINKSSENTFALLQNLLDWASTQMGKTMVVQEWIDLYKISDETLNLLKPIAKNKKISLTSEISENTIAFADKNMVSTVFLNLITNAIKFTPHGGQINVRSITENKHVEVVVEDNGVGITPENIDKLFRLDQKIQTEGTAKEKGTGLGLVLCKEFIEKNNGKIWVESEVGKGSQFYFSLPT